MSYLARLSDLKNKSTRHYLGLMSGTSLDGLDIAHCEIQNHGYETKVNLRHFITLPYSEAFKIQIRTAFAQSNAPIQQVLFLDRLIADTQSKLIKSALAEWNLLPENIDLIASHGQTLFHAPNYQHQNQNYGHVTLQIGDGDFIAEQTGILTLSDFRIKHIAAGGEGAPLALYGDELILSHPELDRILLNIGGIANYTFLPHRNDENKIPFSTDTGPGNTMMDAFTQKYFQQPYDKNALIAQKGQPHQPLLEKLLTHPFFKLDEPKTTGPEVFNLNYLEEKKQELDDPISLEDQLATLSLFSAKAIAQSMQTYVSAQTEIYLSGGGAHNPLLIQHLQNHFPKNPLKFTDQLGIPMDAKEAILFAILANECLFGQPHTYRYLGEHSPRTVFGKLSFP